MKKIIAGLLIATVSITTVIYGSDIGLKVNNKTIECDVPSQVVNGRTLVPLRAIFENIGAKVEWDADNKLITAKKNKTTVKMKVGEASYYINDKEKDMDVAPQIINGRTMVPARYAAEAFGLKVDWDAENKIVIITDKNNKVVNVDVANKKEASTETTTAVVSTKKTTEKTTSAAKSKTVKETTTETTTMYAPAMCCDIPDVKFTLQKDVINDIKSAIKGYNIGNYADLNRFKDSTRKTLVEQWDSKAVSPNELEFVKQSKIIYQNIGLCYKRIDTRYNKYRTSKYVMEQCKKQKETIDEYIMSYYTAKSIDDVTKVATNIQNYYKKLPTK